VNVAVVPGSHAFKGSAPDRWAPAIFSPFGLNSGGNSHETPLDTNFYLKILRGPSIFDELLSLRFSSPSIFDELLYLKSPIILKKVR